MAVKVGKQFVSILVRSKKFPRGIPYKSSLHLEREIEERRERERSRKYGSLVLCVSIILPLEVTLSVKTTLTLLRAITQTTGFR